MSLLSRMSKKHKFVADGVFYAELSELMSRELAEEGFAGVEVRNTPTRTEIIIRATRTKAVLGEKGQRIRELTSTVQKRFGFREGTVELYAERVPFRGLCAAAQCESLKYKLLEGLAVRRACYGVVRFVMESGARGVEVRVGGKLRSQRGKMMKFRDGYMIKSGNACKIYKDKSTKHVLLRSGTVGITVIIMLPYDPTGKMGPKIPQPDFVTVYEPKEEAPIPLPVPVPISAAAPAPVPAPAPAPVPAVAAVPVAPTAQPTAPATAETTSAPKAQ